MNDNSPKQKYLEILRKKAEREAQLSRQKEFEKKNKVKQKAWIYNFIDQFNIRAGSHEVPNYIIYYWYRREYQPTTPEHGLVKKIPFFREFNKYFESGRKGKQRFYYLNKDSFNNLTREVTEKAKHYEKIYEREVEKRKEKEKQEKRRRLSKLKKEFKPKE